MPGLTTSSCTRSGSGGEKRRQWQRAGWNWKKGGGIGGAEQLERQVATLYFGLQPAGGAAAQTRLWSGSGVAGGGAVGLVPGTSSDSAHTQHLPETGWGPAVSIPAASAQA